MRLFLCTLLLSAASLPSRSAYADHCTDGHVRLDSDGKRLEVAFHNRCDQRVTCKVDWQLRCGKDAKQARLDEVHLDGKAEERVSLSAASCGEGDWEISPPRWRCEEPQPIIDGDKPRRHRR